MRILVIFFVLVLTSPSYGCKCAPPKWNLNACVIALEGEAVSSDADIEKKLKEKVDDIEANPKAVQKLKDIVGGGYIETKFKVLKKLKGKIGDKVVVKTRSSSCTVYFRIGSKYRVCTGKNLFTHMCMPNWEI